MKIIQKTDSLMVLKDSPQLKSFAIGAILIVIGIILATNPNLSTPPVPMWLSVLVMVAGILVAILTKDTTLILDKGQGKISFDRHNLIGSEKGDYTMDQVNSLKLQQSIYTTHSRKGGTHTNLKTELFLNLKGGKVILLDSHTRSGHSVWSFAQSQNMTTQEQIGRDISDFIKVQLIIVRPPTVTDVISKLQGASPIGMEKAPIENVEKPPAPEIK